MSRIGQTRRSIPICRGYAIRWRKRWGSQKTSSCFVGELIDVKDEERAWQGAIERALGGLRLTLTVPEDRYRLVTGWLNSRYVGLHVRAQVVREAKVFPRFKEDGFLRKLEWRSHPYRDWLKHYLARFDLACVTNRETLDITPFSMTQPGLIHRESGRFEKRDLRRIDDRSDWCLGFSNARRLALLQGKVRDAEEEVRQATVEATQARKSLDATDKEVSHWKELLSTRWARIDVPRGRHLLKELEQSLRALEAAAGDLAQAKLRWEAAKSRAANVRQQLDEKNEAVGETRKDLKLAQANEEQARRNALAGITQAVRDRLVLRIGDLQDGQLEHFGVLEAEQRSGVEHAMRQAADQFQTAAVKPSGL